MQLDEAFDVLGISPESTYLAAQRAYRTRARTLHPDVVDESRRAEAATAMARTNIAWARIRAELRPSAALEPVADSEGAEPEEMHPDADAPSRWHGVRDRTVRAGAFVIGRFTSGSRRRTTAPGGAESDESRGESSDADGPAFVEPETDGPDVASGPGTPQVEVDDVDRAATDAPSEADVTPDDEGESPAASTTEPGERDPDLHETDLRDSGATEDETSDGVDPSRSTAKGSRRRRWLVPAAAAAVVVAGLAASSLTGSQAGPDAYVGECLSSEGNVVSCSTDEATHRVDSVEQEATACAGPVFASRARDAYFCTTVL